MDMARILIIKTPQKYKKTTHSARISPLFCVPTAIFDGWRDGGWGDGGLSGMEENKKSASPKKNCGCRKKMVHRVYQGWLCPYLWAGICVWVCYLNERAVCEALFFLGGKFGGIGELL